MTEALHFLKKYFGYTQFREPQADVVSHILAGGDALVLMPTGGGKSLCYQLPALMLPGTTVVVSPLISLMKDQVDQLRANGICAAALNSSSSSEEFQYMRAKTLSGELKLLYVSPERLLLDLPALLRDLHVGLFAIDEAHCISQW
ncbi:MAG: DEAD/DEAH box helicase, partial [Bacteroidaceae bacterium]|nr:DEAD/DEAH box helicase [Bacteroidaceae bacterium]